MLLVLSSGESHPSRGGGASSLPFGGGGGRQLWTVPRTSSAPSGASSFLKYFCSQEGTMLFTVSVTRLMSPDGC